MVGGVGGGGLGGPIGELAAYVGGKNGTSENENDAWFVGFSNEVTIAVWVGYDNAGDKRRTLGSGETGAKVAGPRLASGIEAAGAGLAPGPTAGPPSRPAPTPLAALRRDL